jgi:hypothetical protein
LVSDCTGGVGRTVNREKEILERREFRKRRASYGTNSPTCFDDVAGDILDRALGNGLPNERLAANFRALVHGESHLVAYCGVIDLAHPRTHDMNYAEDDIAGLLATVDPRECLCHVVCFHVALVRQHISKLPARCEPMNGRQCFCHSLPILLAHKRNERRHPSS